MESIDGSNGVIFFAAGVFHYFKAIEVKHMILTLSNRFPKGRLIFDAVGKLGLKLMMSKTLKSMGIENVDGMFYIDDPKKDFQIQENIRISSRGYMQGYYRLKDYGIHIGHRFLSQIGDKTMHMAVHRVEFH